jgi:hypothetical protein
VVWEGWSREAPPYPDHWHIAAQSARAGTRQLSEHDLKLRGHDGRLVVDRASEAAIMIRESLGVRFIDPSKMGCSGRQALM